MRLALASLALLRIAALAAVAAGASALIPAVACAQPAPILWEQVGQPDRFGLAALLLAPGPLPDGSLDTLYVSGPDGVWRQPPGGPFGPSLYGGVGGDHLVRTREGYLLMGTRAGVLGDGARSTNGGRTWEGPLRSPCGVVALLQSTLPALGGAVYAACYPVLRSFQGGAPGSWTDLGHPGGELKALGEVPPSPALPAGRLLAGTQGGAAYSDDGGTTWAPGVGLTGFFIVNGLAFSPDPSHPFGGTAYAAVRDFSADDPGVYASEDGGATWGLRYQVRDGAFGLADPNWVRVAVGPGGALYLGVEDVIGGLNPSLGTVARSLNGGATWEEVASGFGGWGVTALAVGRDGRLYAATSRGAWRTADPLPVASEPPLAPDDSGLRLGVRPNPSRGSMAVRLTVPSAGAVRVVAYDVRGREVAVLHDGPLGAGSHALMWEATGLAPGVYVVRATTGGATTSQTVTLAR